MIMKRVLKLAGVLCIVCLLAACGGRADGTYVGKWICVSGSMDGMSLTGDDVNDFSLELRKGSRAIMEISGQTHKIKWKNDAETLTLKIDGVETVGTLGDDTITFDDMLNMGLNLTFAREGSEAALPENSMPEADKAMLGVWQSTAANDILGDPMDAYSANALVAEFTADHMVKVTLEGKELGSFKWSLLDAEWGSVDDGSIELSWDINQDGTIVMDYVADGEYYCFPCEKQ